MSDFLFEQYDYNRYLIEQEFLDKMSVINVKYNGIITEQNYQVYMEDVKTTVMDYIRKVIANIQKVWNDFKIKLNDDKYSKLKSEYNKYFSSNFIMNINDKDFKLPIFEELEKLLDLSIPSDIRSSINDLSDTDTFVKNNFSYLYDEKEKSLSKVAEQKIFKTLDTVPFKINSEKLNPYIKFLDNYKNKAIEISDNISKINSATRSAESILNSVNSTETMNNTEQKSNNEAFNLNKTLNYYFNEAEDNKEDDNENKSTFSSATPKAEANNNEISKQINVYFKVCTQVLSIKLSMLNKAERISFSIVRNFVVLAKKELGNESDNQKKEDSKSDQSNTDTQVKI